MIPTPTRKTDAWGTLVSGHRSELYQWYPLIDRRSQGERTGEAWATRPEGRVTQVVVNSGATSNFTYNALGQLVEKNKNSGTYTEYAYDAAGRAVMTSNRTAAMEDLIPLGGRMLAKYQSGVTYFMHPNPLGTSLTVTDNASVVQQDLTYYPFGGRAALVSTNIIDERFASLPERDPDSSLDFAPFRTYNPTMMRWLSPDPLAGDISDPQSLNRYSYVVNNPCSLADPLGLDPCKFNIAINTNGLISNSQLKILEDTLQSIFAKAGVGVNFSFSGSADYTLDVTSSAVGRDFFQKVPGLVQPSAQDPNAAGETPGFENYIANYGFAYVDRLVTAGYNAPTSLAAGLGQVGAHEAGHYLLHIGDNPQNIGIMAQPGSATFYSAFSGGQAIILRDKCKELHPQSYGGGAGSVQMWSGPEIDWLAFWANSLFWFPLPTDPKPPA